MKVAIYVRVSTADQDYYNQLVALRLYAEKEGWEIFEEYCDVISGSKDTRPKWDLMFQHASRRLFDVVLFWSLDRFSRSGTLFTLKKLKELENYKIDWVSYQEQYIRSVGAFSDVVISIMSTVAKLERERLSERTKAGLKNAKNVGKRGKDKKPRKVRADRGLKRVPLKMSKSFIKKVYN